MTDLHRQRNPGKGLTVPKNPALALRQLNTKHGSSDQTDSKTSETNLLQNKPTTKQTNNTTNSHTRIDSPNTGDVAGTEEVEGVGEVGGQEPEASDPDAERIGTTTSRKSTSGKKTNLLQNKPTTKQTNNTTNSHTRQESTVPLPRRDGRTLRNRQAVSDPAATIVTSFRLPAALMETLDEFCFQHRLRKQDVLQQALEAFFISAEDDGE